MAPTESDVRWCRTPGLIRRDSPENYRVVLAMAGTHRLVQDGRVALVHPGELAIYDFCRPYDLDDDTQVMLLTEPAFDSFASKQIADPGQSTQVILALGVENRAQVDALVDKALAAGATAVGPARDSAGRYQRGFFDLDGHHWEPLCLA